MKVMHFIHGLNTGGAETLVKNYMLNFDKENFDVVLLSMDRKKSPYEKELAKSGIKIIYVQDFLPLKGRVKILNKFYQYLIVKRIIRKESPNILHIHLFLNRFVKFAKPPKTTKIFYTVHSEPEVLWRRSDNKRRRELKATKWLVRYYDMEFIVLHEEMKKEIENMFGTLNVTVLNNGVDIERIKNSKNGKEVRMELGIPENAFVVGHVGRFSEVKNQSFLADIFMEIKNSEKNAFLLMVGEGNKKDLIIDKLNGHGLSGHYLVLSGRIDVPDLLNIMDVFVFPSKYEGLGMAVVEAQEAKIPCFISDKIPEHAINSNLVTRISLNDKPDEWANIILKYKRPKKIEVDKDSWDIKNITKELERIYLGVLAEGKNGKE